MSAKTTQNKHQAEDVQKSNINSLEKNALKLVLSVLENKELKGSLSLKELSFLDKSRDILMPLTK